jgi:flagellar motor protein MotB
MAGKPKPQEEESGEGAPLWIVSFADMISLLMAFFVMLTTFSSFGPRESEKIRTIARLTVTPNYGWHRQIPQSALRPTRVAAGDGSTGSERPTLESADNGKSMKESYSADYKNAKIFVAESSGMFLAKGQAISPQGRGTLDKLAAYLGKVPGQIVIFEKGPAEDTDLSVARAVSVVRYLQERGIPKERCNISASTMLEGVTAARQMEIVIANEIGTE